MNVVFYAPNFHPMIGGVENIVLGLSTELTGMGHLVRVLTLARTSQPDNFSFEVIRGANSLQSIRHIRWADVVVHVNISLKGIVPMLLIHRPLIVYHNGVYSTRTISGRLKWQVTKKIAVNVGCSSYISKLFGCSQTIPNPYKDVLFRRIDSVTRNKELIFLGRLVSEKGCDVLLRALHQLKHTHGAEPTLTIIGDGPEKSGLAIMAKQLGIENQVVFEGARVGEDLARCLNQHQILVVPSTYDEPFGAVGIEGIACGCFIISSDGGGLPDTVGPCGITFPKGDYNALADKLQLALSDPVWRIAHERFADTHLSHHTLRTVTEQFIDVFNAAVHD